MADQGIYINVDTTDVSSYLYGLGQEKQINFAVSVAINRIAKMIQEAIRGSAKDKINFRKLVWNMNAIKISKFSNKNDLLTILQIDPKAANMERLVSGADHINMNGRKYVPIPNVSVFGKKVITRDNPLSIASLNLQPTPNGSLAGKDRTLLVHANSGTPIIIQEPLLKKNGKAKKMKGQNRTGNRVLYTLVKSIRTPIKLDFFGIAQKIVDQYLMDELTKAVQEALNTSKRNR
jgi:hypothetical protein